MTEIHFMFVNTLLFRRETEIQIFLHDIYFLSFYINVRTQLETCPAECSCVSSARNSNTNLLSYLIQLFMIKLNNKELVHYFWFLPVINL